MNKWVNESIVPFFWLPFASVSLPFMDEELHGPMPSPPPSRPWSHRFVQAGPHRVFHLEQGAGDPIVCIHGLGGWAENFADVIPALAEKNRVLAFDLPGFGRSDRPAAEYTLDYLVDWIRTYVDALGLGRFTLIGNSLGGALAIEFAHRYPDRVSRLVLAASAGFGRDYPVIYRLMTVPLVRDALMYNARTIVRMEWEQLLHRKERVTDAFVEGIYQFRLRFPQASAKKNILRNSMGLLGPTVDLYDRLPLLKCPVLIVWGREDRILPVAMGETAHTAVPGSELVVFDGCGHLPMVERPEEFVRVVREFFSRHPA